MGIIVLQYQYALPPGLCFSAESRIGRQGVGMAVLAILLLALAGCEPFGWAFNAENGGGGGMMDIRILISNAGRSAMAMDDPDKTQVQYYEAILREHGTSFYYKGAAVVGESYIVVSVIPGRRYDILVLAGTPANGNPVNGTKVLLASGYEDNNGTGYLIDWSAFYFRTDVASSHERPVL